jgi:hypothetical protein
MNLNDLNKNNISLGLKKTNPSFSVPMSNSLVVNNKMKQDEGESEKSDVSTADQALRTKEIIDTQTISAPSRSTPDIRRPPNINNIPA